MSRQLPPRPNLEHLKNQAKEKLENLQRQNPAAKLADALHVVAREYGFAAWPQLKAHVVAVLGEPQNPFVGNWIADRVQMEFEVDGEEVTITDVSVVDGKEQRARNIIQADGVEHPWNYRYVLKASWLGANVLETIVTKDREVVGNVRYEVSSDGATLTLDASSRDHDHYPATKQHVAFASALHIKSRRDESV